MDIDEMRRRYREKNGQQEVIPQYDETQNVQEATHLKHGEPSSVSISDGRIDYEKGANKVTFSCSRIDNISEDETGILYIDCYISDKEPIDDRWQTDNHSFIGGVRMGFLEKGYGFPDVHEVIDIPQEAMDLLAEMSSNDDECHFVFVISEDNADGNVYNIKSFDGGNINKILLAVDDESIELHFYRSQHKIKAFLNGEPFTGALFSTDDRVEWDYKYSILDSIFVFHDNNEVAIMWWRDNYTFYDCNGNEINKDEFDKWYKSIRDIYVNARIEREKLSIDMD